MSFLLTIPLALSCCLPQHASILKAFPGHMVPHLHPLLLLQGQNELSTLVYLHLSLFLAPSPYAIASDIHSYYSKETPLTNIPVRCSENFILSLHFQLFK